MAWDDDNERRGRVRHISTALDKSWFVYTRLKKRMVDLTITKDENGPVLINRHTVIRGLDRHKRPNSSAVTQNPEMKSIVVSVSMLEELDDDVAEEHTPFAIRAVVQPPAIHESWTAPDLE